MTTIAWRAGVLAADTLHTWNGTRDLYEPKVWRIGQRLAAASSKTSLIFKFRKWVEDGMEGESPFSGVEAGGNGFVVEADGSATCFDQTGAFPVRQPFYALGSGSDLATGAMGYGASAEEAVAVAIRFDTGSGGEITALRLREADTPPPVEHTSDCAVHNEPAFPAGPCSCGAEAGDGAQFHIDFQRGWMSPVRHRRGDAPNTWGSKINDCAERLDSMQLPPDAVVVLRELFEEIGQQMRDAFALAADV